MKPVREVLLLAWNLACESHSEQGELGCVSGLDFSVWSGNTKDLLIDLGLEWCGVADRYVWDDEHGCCKPPPDTGAGRDGR